MRLHFLVVLAFSLMLVGCNGQSNKTTSSESTTDSSQPVGGGCDGCEIMYVGMPRNMNSTDTSAGWTELGQKLLVTGAVYQLDGKTPASDVIIYYWQTDNNGLYSPGPDMDARAKIHGHIRGWLRTDRYGKFSIYTVRPASYPNTDLPAHIHLSIKEPDVENEYYIDDINFDDDPLLQPFLKKSPANNRGGSGVVRVELKSDIQVAEHDIVLGLNIPNYRKKL